MMSPSLSVSVQFTVIAACVSSISAALRDAEGATHRDEAQTPLVDACPTCKWPQFSWNTLPVFFHSCYTQEVGFPETSLKTISRFPIVTIEKWQGCLAKDYTTESAAMLIAAKQVKEANPNASVIVWFDSFRIYSNKTLNPDAENKGGQFCINSDVSRFMETNPQYLLKNISKEPALESYCHLHVYDHTQAFVRQYWTDVCLNMTKSGVIDGCGCDGSQQRATTGPTGGVPHVPLADEWNSGKINMMNSTRLALGNGLLLGKEPEELGTYMTAILHEGCTNNNGTINALRDVAARSVATATPLLFECHFGGSKNEKNLESQIAAFLIGAGEYHYWGSGSWDQASPDFSSRWYGDFFEKPLGKPLALATYDVGTTTWRRSFASGTTVAFNASSNVGEIHWGGSGL